MTDMTVADVARVCNVTERTVRRWLREGRLPAQRVGGRVRVPARAVHELATPYGTATTEPPSLDWLDAPDRLAAMDARRTERAIALMDQVRSMSTGVGADGRHAGSVREARDEQDARWDERLP